MTKLEKTGKRLSPLSEWVRINLPDSSTGLCIQDIDWCIYNYKTKKLMILEEKILGAVPSFSQKEILKVISRALSIGLKEMGIKYLGCHLVTFEKDNFDGDIFFDNFIITQQGLKEKLSLE